VGFHERKLRFFGSFGLDQKNLILLQFCIKAKLGRRQGMAACSLNSRLGKAVTEYEKSK